MLVIRPEQLVALASAQDESFVAELANHVQVFAPAHATSLGREKLLEVIRWGVQKARGYGFELRASLRLYVELMFMFGSHFDTDLQVASVTKVLYEPVDGAEMARADRLHELATAYAQAVSGPGHEYERMAMQRLERARFEQVLDLSERPPSGIASALRAYYPEKYDFVGHGTVEMLAANACVLANQQPDAWQAAAPLFAGLMFTFGCGCTVDPQYPWISLALSSGPAALGGRTTVERLFDKFKTYVKRARANIEGET